jgi:hypothetical protein
MVGKKKLREIQRSNIGPVIVIFSEGGRSIFYRSLPWGSLGNRKMHIYYIGQIRFLRNFTGYQGIFRISARTDREISLTFDPQPQKKLTFIKPATKAIVVKLRGLSGSPDSLDIAP